jgi:ATP-dependent Lhr-like helicase
MMSDEAHWAVLPHDVREWLELQREHSAIPSTDEMLLETFPRGTRHFLVCYPFEGRLAHTTLCMLLTRRLARLGVGPLGFVANDYALAVWALKPMDDIGMAELFAEDMLGDDLEAWLAESAMMKGAFKACALISGLIERRFPGDRKTARQVTFSTDLVYDVLRRHQPDHLLLRCAREDAAHGLIDAQRLGDLLQRIRGRILHKSLPHLSPFSVSAMMEIGKQPSPGDARDQVLAAVSEADLVAEALA